MNGKTMRGRVIDAETGEILIGMTVIEYDNATNFAQTDTNGNFQLTFSGNTPLVILSGYCETYYIELDKYEFNNIILDKKTIKKSRRTYKKSIQSDKKRK
jgi:hypothetical protein